MNSGTNAADEDDSLSRWLVEHADKVLAEDGLPSDTLRLTKYLRARFSPEQTGQLIKLRDLRHRARQKFSKHDRLFFTQIGLEQATDETIANYKAQRFAPSSRVVDLCCGIGGDAMGLAARCDTTAVDRDEPTATFVRANLLRCGSNDARVIRNDIREVDLRQFDAWHLDPDRRTDGRRKSHPDYCEPPLEEFLTWPGLPPHGAAKLSPAADPDHLLDRGAEMEWIGHQRQCQQLVVWFGNLAKHPGQRTATYLRDDAGTPTVAQFVEEPCAEEIGCWPASQVPNYVYEPQAPVLAAGLQDALAARHKLLRLEANVAYYASNALVSDPLMSCFSVVEIAPLRPRSLKRRLRELGAHVIEVKKRGVRQDPLELQRQLANKGTAETSLLLFPRGKSTHVVVAQRLAD